ncbi:MAG: hypothetical protein M0042_05170 [Nitrospiraceae bacterium]|nr:hypothetical protein [Nitrospiraceae bacterium]
MNRLICTAALFTACIAATHADASECDIHQPAPPVKIASDASGRFAAFSADKIVVKDVENNGCRTFSLKDWKSIGPVALAPGGSMLATVAATVSAPSKTQVRMINIYSLEERATAIEGNVIDVRYSPGGEYFLATRTTPTVAIAVYETSAFKPLHEKILSGDEQYGALDFKNGNRFMIVTRTSDSAGIARLYRISSSADPTNPQMNQVELAVEKELLLSSAPIALRFSPDGTAAALVSELSGTDGIAVEVLSGPDLGRRTVLKSAAIKKSAFLDIVWSEDGRYLRCLEKGDATYAIRRWEWPPLAEQQAVDYSTDNWALMYAQRAERIDMTYVARERASQYTNAAVEMKKTKLPDDIIVEHLFHEARKEAMNGTTEGVFGNMILSGEDVNKLKQAGFQDDFIKKMEGQPEYVTVGVAGIWLNETAELVAAPMIRIFIAPKSYYTPRKPLFEPISSEYPHLRFPTGIRYYEKWDLNVGYTAAAETSKNPEESKKMNYVLVGISYELNPAALINVGVAVAPGDTKGSQKQIYFGVTVDQTIFKQIGWMK